MYEFNPFTHKLDIVGTGGGGGGSSTLAGDSDVSLSSLSSGQLLEYNGSSWTNWTPNYQASLGYTPLDRAGSNSIAGNIANSATGYFQVAVGTTAQEPGSPASGMLRYNSTTGRYEFYVGGSGWINHVRLNGDTMTGNLTLVAGSTTVAPLKFQSGSLLTSPSAFSLEADTNYLYYTDNQGTPARHTLVSLDQAQTLTNKTINGSSNTISNISLTSSVTGVLPAANAPTLDQIRSAAANVSLNNYAINNVANPTSAQDAATKNYVDSMAQGLSPKASVRLATVAALPANTYSNGSSGVGATLTANANGALSVDGFAVNVGDRILVMNESASANNGIYTVTQTGSGSSPYILTRTTDMNTGTEVVGAYVFAEAGSVNADMGFVCSNTGSVTIGTSAITFIQFTGAAEISVASPIVKSGNQLSFSSSYTGQTSITTLGTITTGTWNGSVIGASYLPSTTVEAITNDTNITGSISAQNLTLGWSGQLGVSRGGTGSGTAFTQGSVVFAGAGGVYSQDNSNFYWDGTNHRLGIGVVPQVSLHIGPSGRFAVNFPVPTGLSISTSTTGGSLAANTYYYVITALDYTGGETTKSAEVSITTTGSTSTVTLNWTNILQSGAYGIYRIYRGTSAGGENVYYQTTITGTATFTDTGAGATNGTPPTVNTAYIINSNPLGYGDIITHNNMHVIVNGNNGFLFDNTVLGKNNWNMKCGSDGTFLFDQGGGNNGRFKLGGTSGSNYFDWTPDYSNSYFKVAGDKSVKTYNNTLDDGSGDTTIVGTLTPTKMVEKIQSIALNGGTINIDWSQGRWARCTISAATTVTFSNPLDGSKYVLELIENGTGGYSVTLPTMNFATQTYTQTTTANKRDFIDIKYSGSTYYAQASTNF